MTSPVSPFPPDWPGELRVTLAHDWLTGMRGGERVLELLADGFPEAPILTLLANPAAISERIRRHRIQTSWLQRWPGITAFYRHLLPLFPLALRTLPRPEGDLLISTSHCVIKALPRPPQGRHLCYCFTPMRYAWLFRDEYFGRSPLRRLVATPAIALLRRWDRQANANVDCFVAISRHVQERIRRFYGREALCVYPPANTDYWRPSGDPPGDYYLAASALVPYKKIDLAIRTCHRFHLPLKVVGEGSERRRLESLAGPTIEFLGRVSDPDLRRLYQRCRALIFPGEEDFGIIPLEAMACGRPVIAFGRGGATETVLPGVSGFLFETQTEESLYEAIQKAEAHLWDPLAIRAQAERFSIPRFLADFAATIRQCLAAEPTPRLRR